MNIRKAILEKQRLEKAKAQPVGTINKYDEMKMGDGTWKYVGKQGHSHPAAKEARDKGHYKHTDEHTQEGLVTAQEMYDFIEELDLGFDPIDKENMVYGTRENSTRDGSHSPEDIKAARELQNKIIGKFPSVSGKVTTENDWVFLTLSSKSPNPAPASTETPPPAISQPKEKSKEEEEGAKRQSQSKEDLAYTVNQMSVRVESRIKNLGLNRNSPSAIQMREGIKKYDKICKQIISKIGKKYELKFTGEAPSHDYLEYSYEIGMNANSLKRMFPDDYEKASPSLSTSQLLQFGASKAGEILNSILSTKFGSSGFGYSGTNIYFPIVSGSAQLGSKSREYVNSVK